MIIAHQRENAAVFGRSGQIRMAEHVTGSINARPFAVPDGEHPVIFALAQQFRLLRAPAGRRGQFFIQSRLEKSDRHPEQFLKMVATFQSINQLENQLRQKLNTMNKAKMLIVYNFNSAGG